MKLISNTLIVIGIIIIIIIFFPIIKTEVFYYFKSSTGVKYSPDTLDENAFNRRLAPPNTDYSIVIPKIGAAAPVISDVDPSDPKKYLPALKNGVAQAKGTARPGDWGNVYLFAHSTDTFWNVSRYNAVFFLIGKLKPEDSVLIYYRNHKIEYEVTDVAVVNKDNSQYFAQNTDEKILTLQTCYPPGTTLKRLIVIAKQISITNN